MFYMELRELISAHLPNAVVAAVIFTLYNISIDGIADPLTIALNSISYVITIFLGFVIITPILDRAFGSNTT